MSFHLPRWLRSVHAKLFLLTALVTAGVTVGVGLVVVEGSRREALNHTRQLAVDTAQNMARQIRSLMESRGDRQGEFRHARDINALLEDMAGPTKFVDQVDVFQRLDFARDGYDGLCVVASSLPDDSDVKLGPELMGHLQDEGHHVRMVTAAPRGDFWEVLLPIESLREGRPPIGLVRVRVALARWEAVWAGSLARTTAILPLVIAGEFLLLWVILGFVLSDPLKRITRGMALMAEGDTQVQVQVDRKDELGLIAAQFNAMAARLHEISLEREKLLAEVQGLNANLQTRIEEALEALHQQNQELEALNERNALLRDELAQQERLAVAGQLTAAFAHEVGTPLNLVNGHLQLLLAQGDLPERNRERLEVIHTQIERVGDIVRKLLGLTRRPQLNPVRTSLHALLDSLHHLWSPSLFSHRIAFELDAPEDCTLLVDQKQMEQVFLNLVNNAVDAMPEGGRIDLKASPDPSAGNETPRWSFELSDTGGGIPPEVLPKVFKPMFTTKPEGKGTGLGLPIVREIIRHHGGEIRIQSRVGLGTTVIFSLPGAPPEGG